MGNNQTNNNGSKGRTINDGALEHLKEKYGEEFTYLKAWGSIKTAGVRQILVSCESMPGKEILVVINNNDRPATYHDNYMDYFYEAQTREFIRDVAAGFFDGFSVTIRRIFSPSVRGITQDTVFDDYIRHDGNTIDSYIVVNDSDEDTIMAFYEELKVQGLHFYVRIDIPSAKKGFTGAYYHSSTDIMLTRRVLRGGSEHE
jgi:hypothetical protein